MLHIHNQTIDVTTKPSSGAHIAAYSGDIINFQVTFSQPIQGEVFLRTNLGGIPERRKHLVNTYGNLQTLSSIGWSNHQLTPSTQGGSTQGATYNIHVPVSDSGNYECTLYYTDSTGKTHWLIDQNITVKVIPSYYSSYNAVYSLTPRVFHANANTNANTNANANTNTNATGNNHDTNRPSGTFQSSLPHINYIIDNLKFNILMFLPIFPVPVHYGRMGDYGSYYAPQDYFAVDPAYATFSKQYTPVQQFVNLVAHIHGKGARVFLDLPANHTSWASSAHNRYPQWFARNNNNFKSPGAWGIEWSDLVELQYSKSNKLSQMQSQYNTYYSNNATNSATTTTTHYGELGSKRFEDLNTELMDYMAEVFLFWCKTGVDGFRCDAGYMIDKRIWAYIIARVRTTYPNTLFLLEGLGGSWDDTYALLTEAHMDWAYSELFQTYSAEHINRYITNTDNYLSKGGMLLNFAETHDNNRLATQGHNYALFRVQLCALLSSNGSYGIHSGVEWFATEKFDVHKASSISWGQSPNMTKQLCQLNTLLATHPCFTPHSQTKNINQNHNCQTLAYVKYFDRNQDTLHHSANKGEIQPPIMYKDSMNLPLVILANPSKQQATTTFSLNQYLKNTHNTKWCNGSNTKTELQTVDLLTGEKHTLHSNQHNNFTMTLPPLTILCLSESTTQFAQLQQLEQIPGINQTIMEYQMRLDLYHDIVTKVHNQQENETLYHLFCTNMTKFFCKLHQTPIPPAIFVDLNNTNNTTDTPHYNRSHEQKRIIVPTNYYLVVKHNLPFYVQEYRNANTFATKLNDNSYVFIVPPMGDMDEKQYRSYHIAMLRSKLDNSDNSANISTTLHSVFLSNNTTIAANLEKHTQSDPLASNHLIDPVGVCTNNLGGYAQIRGSWGEYDSKYDALLAANCNPQYPVDRTIVLSKMDIWLRINNYSSPLNKTVQKTFTASVTNHLSWIFTPHMGEYGEIPIRLDVIFSETTNRVSISVELLETSPNLQKYLNTTHPNFTIIMRPFIDRRTNHHQQPGILPNEMANHLKYDAQSLQFNIINNYNVSIESQEATFHHSIESQHNTYTAQDHSRALGEHIALHSPGFFQLDLTKHNKGTITCHATQDKLHLNTLLDQLQEQLSQQSTNKYNSQKLHSVLPTNNNNPNNASQLEILLRHSSWRFLAKRDDGYTVIAGFPWFLDWGRDTLICLRGYIAGGFLHESHQVLHTFAKFELNGTLPNMIAGNNSNNRETSDAPLLFILAVGEYIQKVGNSSILSETVHSTNEHNEHNKYGNTLAHTIISIVEGYIAGTSVGVYMDTDTHLIFSPSHYTWMDTNYPAGTPRQGFPIEIQALWAYALNLTHTITNNQRYKTMYTNVKSSMDTLFYHENLGYYGDCIHAHHGQRPQDGLLDDALRPNQLYLISLGIISPEKSRSVVAQCWDLVVEGGIRSLSNRTLGVPLYTYAKEGHPVENIRNLYRGTYEGDEDTQRKLAYHNGTVWTFMFPLFIESVLTLGGTAHRDACLSMLISMVKPYSSGAVGFMDEVKDGDAPHYTRGTYAQAWSSTEALRVFLMLQNSAKTSPLS